MNPQVALIITVLVLGVGSVVSVLLYSLHVRYKTRENQHRERLAALEKGLNPPAPAEPLPAPWTPRVYLLRGLIWLFSGIALAGLLAGVSYTSQREPDLEFRLWHMKRLKELGATEEQIQQDLAQRVAHREPPLVIALAGLIPVGVGLAYLIYYRAEQKRHVEEQ